MTNRNGYNLAHPAYTVVIVFVVLKMTDVVDWPWVWVFSPVWMLIGLWLVLATLAVTLRAVAVQMKGRER